MSGGSLAEEIMDLYDDCKGWFAKDRCEFFVRFDELIKSRGFVLMFDSFPKIQDNLNKLMMDIQKLKEKKENL